MPVAWLLEGLAPDGSRVSYPIAAFPFRVGRDADNDLTVIAPGLSRRHALMTIDIGTGELLVSDLGSTNGTFVNRARLEEPKAVHDNDIVHFGSAEFRLRAITGDDAEALNANDGRTVIGPKAGKLSEHFVANEREFRTLLQGQGLESAIQPIVAASDGALFAYELLGRGGHPHLPRSPVHLFHLAARLNLEAELSTAFRHHGVEAVAARLGTAALFINAHPAETFTAGFCESLEQIVRRHPSLALVVEIHETAIVETAQMRELGARLAALGVRFAYDDFGAGQARLSELADVPAHFIKFDMGLIHDIDSASAKKQRVVFDLVRLVRDLGSTPLAEGVETEAEAKVCREMGFHLIQGYLTGRPQPVDAPA